MIKVEMNENLVNCEGPALRTFKALKSWGFNLMPESEVWIGEKPSIRYKGYSFREMFVWLSGSLQHVSQSQPNDTVTLKPTSDWGTL